VRLLLLITIPIQSVSASPEDTTPPSAVTDLTVSESGRNYVVLTWTAPGDDGNIGTASKYDIRYSTSPIAEGNWDDAIQCEGEPIPKPPGSSETFKITRLARGTTYYFALKTADEVPNWSPLSRVVSGGYGAVVGEYNGVTAYSNGDNNYYSWDYNTVDSYNSGMKWQCVEYVNRYYYLIYGSQIRIPGTNAIDYYDTASERGLVAYSNGGTTPPQPGDILCSGGGSYGHVAIVRGVTSNSVHVIHQNWTNTKNDNDKSVSMTVPDGHYTLDGFSSSYPVQGWLRRSPEATIQDQSIYPNTASPGDILTFVYNINNLTSDAIPNVRLGARIRKSEPQGSWIDDPSRDKVVTLQPGIHDYSRNFKIPQSVTTGRYDAQWVILHHDTGVWIDSKEMSRILQVTPPPTEKVTVDLYFNKSNFTTGDVKDSTVTVTGSGYTVRTYVLMTKPDGAQRYAYYPNPDFNPTDPLYFSDIKRPLYGGTWNVHDSAWLWDRYQFTGSEPEGTWTWEFWYEDVNNPGVRLASDSANYTFTKVTPPSGRVTVDVETKCWEDQPYQLRIEAYATPLDVSSITISGPHIDTATVHTGGGDPHHLYDDGNHTDDEANDGIWRVELDIVGTPAVGETIIFDIVYNDGSSETKQKSIDGVFSETAQLLSPPDGSTVNTLTPTFVWSNPSVSGLTYSVQVSDTNHNRVYDVYDLPDGTTSHTIPSGYLNWGTTYYWLVSASDANGNEALTKWDTFTTSGTAASTTTAIGQPKFSLSQNYPNPCNPETTIEYSLADSCHVTLKIYNLSGQLIKTLIDEYQQAGSHKITWYGDNDAGQEVASSVYFYRIKAGDFGSTKKMIVLK